MAIGTYAELKTAVANWLPRDNLTARIPEFISIGEKSVFRTLRIRQMEKRTTATFSTEYYDVPTNLIEIRSIKLNTTPNVTTLEYLTPDQMDQFLANERTGPPFYYTIIGEEFRFKPAPDQAYTAEIAYFARFQYLSGDNDTNWLLTNAPDIYLYSAMLAAEPFLDNDKETAKWEKFLGKAIFEINKQDRKARYSGKSLRRRSRTVEEIPNGA